MVDLISPKQRSWKWNNYSQTGNETTGSKLHMTGFKVVCYRHTLICIIQSDLKLLSKVRINEILISSLLVKDWNCIFVAANPVGLLFAKIKINAWKTKCLLTIRMSSASPHLHTKAKDAIICAHGHGDRLMLHGDKWEWIVYMVIAAHM